MSECKGIDVSANNGTVNWSNVKVAGYEFAIIRSSYGRYKVDSQFSANVKGCEAQGLKYGVYHYSYALNASAAKEEAALVLSTIKGCNLSFPVWFDMEDADSYKTRNGLTISKSTITPICVAFCEAIRAAGYKVGVYASKSWLESYIDVSQLGDCDIWLAQWNSKPTWSGTYSVWQNSDSGTITGHSCKFDTDVAYNLTTTKNVTAMQQDESCKAGVVRYAGVSTTLYKNPQLTSTVATLAAGESVNYFGNHCYIDGEKYAYVAAVAGSGYVKAADLRTSKP